MENKEGIWVVWYGAYNKYIEQLYKNTYYRKTYIRICLELQRGQVMKKKKMKKIYENKKQMGALKIIVAILAYTSIDHKIEERVK